jgi:hypothetical protein
MDPQPGAGSVAGPTVMPNPMTMPVPVPITPATQPAANTKPAANSIAECPCEPEPKAEPNIGGQIMSRL